MKSVVIHGDVLYQYMGMFYTNTWGCFIPIHPHVFIHTLHTQHAKRYDTANCTAYLSYRNTTV